MPARRGLLGRRDAYRLIHRPADLQQAMRARRRIIYDELMLMQLGLGIPQACAPAGSPRRSCASTSCSTSASASASRSTLTAAQQNAVWEIARDLGSGRPMNRLLQGDVGSGKTVVALYAMLLGVANKLQAALLAPTEVLAEQHYLTLSRTCCRDSSVDDRAVHQPHQAAGQGPAAARTWPTGKIHLAVGTQALIQEDVEFANLGLVVVDEQHKLGVKQRAVLKGKGLAPHYLVMTATPIPRTLALSYFADFDVTTIDELPPGRQPIKTPLAAPAPGRRRRTSSSASRSAAGRQAYIVVPQIDDNGLDDSKSRHAGIRPPLQRPARRACGWRCCTGR